MNLSNAKIDTLLSLAECELTNMVNLDLTDIRAYRNLQKCVEELVAVKGVVGQDMVAIAT